MEGVCAPAARACHADNVHILPVETPRTFGTLTTHYVSRRRCVTAEDWSREIQNTVTGDSPPITQYTHILSPFMTYTH